MKQPFGELNSRQTDCSSKQGESALTDAATAAAKESKRHKHRTMYFSGDYLSPFLSVMCLSPLIELLYGRREIFSLAKINKLNHLLFMDYLKLTN